MTTQETVINFFQEVLSGIIAGAQQHFMHATINKHRGFNTIGNRMLEENSKEMAEAGIFIDRIIDLGGVPDIKLEKLPVLMDIEAQLKMEYEEQKLALVELDKMISNIKNDDVSKQILQNYITDEAMHTQWLKQQVDLLELIGTQNYLASQL